MIKLSQPFKFLNFSSFIKYQCEHCKLSNVQCDYFYSDDSLNDNTLIVYCCLNDCLLSEVINVIKFK